PHYGPQDHRRSVFRLRLFPGRRSRIKGGRTKRFSIPPGKSLVAQSANWQRTFRQRLQIDWNHLEPIESHDAAQSRKECPTSERQEFSPPTCSQRFERLAPIAHRHEMTSPMISQCLSSRCDSYLAHYLSILPNMIE